MSSEGALDEATKVQGCTPPLRPIRCHALVLKLEHENDDQARVEMVDRRHA
jgi:ribosomal protein S30